MKCTCFLPTASESIDPAMRIIVVPLRMNLLATQTEGASVATPETTINSTEETVIDPLTGETTIRVNTEIEETMIGVVIEIEETMTCVATEIDETMTGVATEIEEMTMIQPIICLILMYSP